MHTRPLCGAQVSDKVRLVQRFSLFFSLYAKKEGLQPLLSSRHHVLLWKIYIQLLDYLEKCLLQQNVLQMSANYILLIFMLPLLLQSFVSVLSKVHFTHFKRLTLDVLLKRSLCVTIFEQVSELEVFN